MVDRRAMVVAATAVAATGALLTAEAVRSRRAHDAAVRATWRPAAVPAGDAQLALREAIRLATLAASSHNTQCWRFVPRPDGVRILPDFSRRLAVVDPDDHHLFASLGCAAENFLHAARALGYAGELHPGSRAAEGLDLALQPAAPWASPLYEAIPRRQSTRGLYDGQPLRNEELRLLEAAGTGAGVAVRLLTDRAARETVLSFVVEGNTLQVQDPAFVAELKRWVRFNGAEAARTGDGLSTACTGNPALPPWLGRRMFDFVFTADSENDKAMRQLRSSAGIAVFVSAQDDWQHWVEAGRAYQRFALQATALGIRTAHLNQPVEVARLRRPFAEALALGSGRPDLVVRFGRGPEMPRSLRRPLSAGLG